MRTIEQVKTEIENLELNITELKNCDPIAYRCTKSNYEGNFDLDDCVEYPDMVEELEILESDLKSLQDELDSLESEAE